VRNPTGVFDALQARGQIAVHASEYERQQAIADQVVAENRTGRAVAVVVDTREQAAVLNSAIRDRLIAGGLVDDRHTTSTHAGESIGAGDLIATRRNNHDLDVANRDTWTVTSVHRVGSVTVTGERGERALPAAYVREHVELGYASTVHGVQGDTAATAHLAVGEHTSAASAYVGMTRGRNANTAHLVADTIDDAREQWVAVFARDRADLGPAHAAEQAVKVKGATYPNPPVGAVTTRWPREALPRMSAASTSNR
jgi:ATP-dependent exoDNAse (exonuclease V) alpha subunit